MVHHDLYAQTVLSLTLFNKTRRRTARRLVLFLTVAGLAACTGPFAPSSTATRPIPTVAPTASHTPPPTTTASPAPTASSTASATPAPTPTIPTDTVVEFGQLPPGFSLTIYAGVTRPTSLAFGPDGRLYAASANQVIYVLADADGDRRAESRAVWARNLPTPLGLLWMGEKLYVSYTGSVSAFEDTDKNGTADRTTPILTGLPNKLHQNDGLVLGPDGYVYLGLGSTCDACVERSPLSASILRFKPDGSDLSVFASGFRNPYDLAFNTLGDLFATENGRDTLGDDLPPEELNHVQAGSFYGWPDCWEGGGLIDCAAQTRAAATFTAHSSADGLAFYEAANFPPPYKGDAFVAVFGSYLLPEIERGVMRVKLTKNGETYTGQSEWFLRLESLGRPLDLTPGPDGGLYVADYERALVYRIVYGAP
jgi:putative membrane-bound dehydrogenase-like protein